MGPTMGPVHRHAIFGGTKDSCLAHGLRYAACVTVEIMTARTQHQFRRAGTCSTQGLQRCLVSRPVVVSVWNKNTGPGTQN